MASPLRFGDMHSLSQLETPGVDADTTLIDLCNSLDTLVGAHWALASALHEGTNLPEPLPEAIRRADDELIHAIAILRALVQDRESS
ncbi:MAG: hypothetical protein ABI724_02075 [Betaproteobacteria bacterium]